MMPHQNGTFVLRENGEWFPLCTLGRRYRDGLSGCERR